jgi:hypothetical protein
MNKKNLTTQTNDSSHSIVELSDKDLQQLVGGVGNGTMVNSGTPSYKIRS